MLRHVMQNFGKSRRPSFPTCSWQKKRLLHTTSSLQSPLAVMPQNENEDIDEEFEQFAACYMKELKGRDTTTTFSRLDDELGESSVWDKPIEEVLEPHLSPEISSNETLLPHEAFSQFDPLNPPSSLKDLQKWLECEAQQESVEKYQKTILSARERGDYSSLGIVQKQVLKWYQPLRDGIEREQLRYLSKTDMPRSMGKYGPYLCSLPAEKLAVILAHESLLHCLTNGSSTKGYGVPLWSITSRIGEAVEAELNVQKLLQKRLKDERHAKKSEYFQDDVGEQSMRYSQNADDISTKGEKKEVEKWMYGAHQLQRFAEEITRNGNKNSKLRLEFVSRRARQLLDSEEEWDVATKIKVGAALLQVLLENTTIEGSNSDQEKAFTHHKVYVKKKKTVGWILLHQDILQMVLKDSFDSKAAISTRLKPMIIPPNKWTGPQTGGYKLLKVDLMRTHGSKLQKEALFGADLSVVYDGLDVLGCTPWKINSKILEVAKECWRSKIVLGDIPSQDKFDVPPKPTRPEKISKELFKDSSSPVFKEKMIEREAYMKALTKHNRMKQKNMNLFSLQCSAIFKLDQAEKFLPFNEIYFPHNMDFRGRAYPIPPHLSNVGSDLCRGMLTFAEKKPLGSRGLYWLKVHLANLAGNDKISFDNRAAFTEENMSNIRAAVENPLGENRWWMTLDDPFQGLATCHEIVQAIDSGDPEAYECSLPVHMDGSCNGLQHYAALGLDLVGGKAVNLCKSDIPQDVYSGVMEEVVRQVAEEADRILDFDESKEDLTKAERKELKRNRGAKLVNGLIDRGVVKRTVMTSVYGVTFIGARKQIQEKIEEKLEEQGYDVDEIEHEIHSACNYLASVTMEAMGKLFSGARETMNWLTLCARLINKQNQPVAWISPIGVPVIQPYRQSKPHTIVTLLQQVTLVDQSDDLPLHKQRQVSAFPPNYVHSLDSSHMLLTALEMDRRGLYFSAVHDSFWTHPCDVEEMNEALRDCFVELYQQPLLERLKETWELRYPSLEFPELPKKGKLNLEDVKSAPYFFQ
eukprot:CAMPEP_0194132834 /NCGR_PEP_ID=MMETSP0152-20130528/3204_1 /TAXON_ID=1049557 /ORGANISM="Thalassiothrix antarctica, Strain L6-D1" /LENGTH=1031 /DNA_ID=CAMNT_0038828011 /DNA_START=95 /DNA_END=3190 /DNA_ORIENTATION=-